MPARIVQFSGGIASWAVAQRVVARHGTDDLVLLFANTQIEDDDVYDFVHSSAAQLGAPLIEVADGRTPWEVFEDKQIIGNSMLAPCSYVLKILPCRRWLTDNTDPADTVLYIGIDNSVRDQRRAPAIRHGWQPWQVDLPLLDEPELTKDDMLAEARALGLTPPAAYSLGWEHANCGQLCVRGGQQHWLRTLEHFPGRYADYEAREQRFRDRTGKNVAILKERRAGITHPLSLVDLRRRDQRVDFPFASDDQREHPSMPLTRTQRRLLDAMKTAVAHGTWVQVPEGPGLTIRYTETRTTPAGIPERWWSWSTYERHLFLTLHAGGVIWGNAPAPWVGRRDSRITYTQAFAILADPAGEAEPRPA